jgi:hypothetical protein
MDEYQPRRAARPQVLHNSAMNLLFAWISRSTRTPVNAFCIGHGV